MNPSYLMLIIAAEISLVLLAACVFLIVQNRSLKRLISEARAKAKGLMHELKQEKLASKNARDIPLESPESSLKYLDHVNEQIDITKGYHGGLNTGQDIALDMAPESPLIHRAPALRHAMLLAEKNALATTENDKEPDWQELSRSYKKIFDFYADYTDEPSPENSEELESLKEELTNAQKRVSNLERFKQLYFDLEKQWEMSKAEAQSHFDNLNSITAEIDNPEPIREALQEYHGSYNNISDMLKAGIDPSSITAQPRQVQSEALESIEEIKKLRAVAEDQHRIIEDLQKQLMSSQTDEERHNTVAELQSELQKQMRFVQESETCIQLMEDELNSAHQEIEALSQRAGELPLVRADYIDLSKQYDELEMKYHKSMTDLQTLEKESQNTGSVNAIAEEASRLRMELAEASAKYNDLEEKFLDLKMNK